jgi:hypothetical protein
MRIAVVRAGACGFGGLPERAGSRVRHAPRAAMQKSQIPAAAPYARHISIWGMLMWRRLGDG